MSYYNENVCLRSRLKVVHATLAGRWYDMTSNMEQEPAINVEMRRGDALQLAQST